MQAYLNQINDAAEFVRRRIVEGGLGDQFEPSIGCILGSGLGELGNQVERAVHIDFESIPHFPRSTVEGHQGRLVVGELEGQRVIIMQGRIHYYEGYTMKQVVFPIYVMKKLGITSLLVTNAAGGMNRGFAAGNLMLIRDHINMTGNNPLIGPNFSELGVRFPDMSAIYDLEYREFIHKLARQPEFADVVQLQEGVYCGISGPAYMTPGELNMLAMVGGDAIGMSTVPEAIAARHAGLRVLGISCITDMAIGDELEPLTHEQVMSVAERTKPGFIALVRAFLRQMPVTL